MRNGLRVFVPGLPRPQGSGQAMISASTGKPFIRGSKTLPEWRNAVVTRVTEAIELSGFEKIESGPVRLNLAFVFDRPKSHSKAQVARDLGWKANGADLDKLCRAVGDALTVAGAYGDDRQVALLAASKQYANPESLFGYGEQGVHIDMSSLDTSSLAAT